MFNSKRPSINAGQLESATKSDGFKPTNLVKSSGEGKY